MRRAPPEDIEAAPVEIAALVLLVGGVHSVPDARRLIGLHAGAADLRVEQSGDGEGVVADEFGVEPHARSAGKEAVIGILLQLLRRHGGRLPIGRARHHQADQRLHVPRASGLKLGLRIDTAAVAELHCQPIQQLGMARPFALRAEVVRGLHEAVAEEHGPIAVHGDAGGERILFRDQPSREGQTIRGACGQRGQERGRCGRHLLALGPEVAAHEHEGVPRRIHLLHDEGRRDLGVEGVLGLFRIGQALLGADEVDGMVLLVEAREVRAFLGGAVAARAVDDRQVGIEDEQANVLGRQGAVVDADVVDQSGEGELGVARTDADGLGVRDGTLQLILLHLHLAELAVDIELHAGGLGRAVMRGEDVEPLVRGQDFFRADLERVVRPLRDEVQLQFGFADEQVVAAISRLLLDPAEDGAVLALELDPRAVAEGVRPVEGEARLQCDMRLAIELEGLAKAAIGELDRVRS